MSTQKVIIVSISNGKNKTTKKITNCDIIRMIFDSTSIPYIKSLLIPLPQLNVMLTFDQRIIMENSF